jgi:hypothetical protein
MTKVLVKLERDDREPGGDHVYGARIDKLIAATVGGVEKFNRRQYNPSARIPGTNARIELHEDGPLIQTVIEQIPALIGACASLITAWCAWRSTRKDLPAKHKRTLRRTVRVTVGNHTYEGQLAPKDVKRVASLLASLGR